jgi:flagellar biogenesis protein FliO
MKCVVDQVYRFVPCLGLVALLCVGFGSDCFAEISTSGIGTSEPFDMTGSMIRMLGGFLFCLGLFGAGIHVYKRYFMQSCGKVERRLKILERLPVSAKNSLLLVELDGRELLLATGPDSPRMLTSRSKREVSFDDTLLDAAVIGEEFNA